MRTTKLALFLLGPALVAGCAHTEPKPDARAADAQEVALLRERVQRLERRLSDLDARLSLLTERLERPRDAVSLGAPPLVLPIAPAEPAPEPVYAGIGTASIDIPRPAPEPEPAPLRSLLVPVASVPKPPVVNERAASLAAKEEPARPASVDALYQWAQEMREAGRCLDAIAAFEDILERHRSHPLADNALYWIGVCHQARGEHRLAIDVWRQLPIQFPESPKLADALFGMAMSHEALGEPVLAEALYDQLLEQYPRAEKAPQAKRALARLAGE